MFLGVLIYYYDMTFNFFFKKIIFKKKTWLEWTSQFQTNFPFLMIVENHIQGMLPRARGQKNVSTKVTSMFLPDFVFVGCVCAVS